MPGDPLQHFSAPTQAWFRSAFAAPTDAQARAWESLATGASTLVSAPTGSGKTLAAFLVAIDRLLTAPPPAKGAGSRVLYVSPLKALVYDVDRNLRAPLAGIAREAGLLGAALSPVTVGMRTGDTSSQERQRMARRPPDILVTTPESLFLLLTSAARETLAGVETVILDEVHAVAATKRGAHLALCIERLEELAAARGGPGLQRIGLSATQRPLEVVGRFLAGGAAGADGAWAPRPVRIVESASEKSLDLEIIVPVEDMSRLGETIEVPPTGPVGIGDQSRRSIWPAVHPRILDLVMAHRSTIVFVNSRRLAERLCARLNELAQEAAEEDAQSPDDGPAPILARAHHGSVAREQRLGIEEDLKAGRLRCVVATSSLELGIDMGAVDLVIQVESPGSVASGVQRIGRAGHQVGAPSVGKIFPKYRGDLVECAVVVRRMLRSEIEETRILRNPLDVLAQQIVAMAAMDPWDVDRLHALVRRAAGFADLSRAQLDGVLDMLSGRYPSDEFAELRPRLNWDRVADRITGRPGAQRLAVTSGGTIPDRGLYGVFIAGEGPSRGEGGRVAAAGGRGSRRVGELDEEMVYETRPGETFTLGSSTWRVEDITRDQVLVTPAPGQPGKMPFWHGDGPGRPIEVGRAVGAFVREIGDLPPDEAITRLAGEYGLDDLAAVNLVAYLADQREATGSLPSDRSLVIERFRDEIGDWRVVVLSPFGGPVHAPWALAIEAQARERLGLDVQTMHADDGIVVRVPEADEAPPADLVLVDPERVQDLVISRLGGSALFASRFRECAARALLLPRRRPGGRTPLWQQRQRAADLLAVASRYPSFPITLETYRECLRDVFDVPALIEILSGVASRRIRTVQVETPVASPFASSLLFDYIAGYMYDGDTPLAERRAHALSLDRELLAELLGSDELRELIDPDALDAVEAEAQRLAPDRLARGIDGVHDLLRQLGDLRADEVGARCEGTSGPLLEALESARRAYRLRIAGEERWVAVEDAARFRDALGLPPPPGMPDAFLEPVERPMIDLVARYARTHGPFEAWEVAERLALPRDAVELSLKELEREGRVLAGAFRPAGTRSEWCDAEILRRLRRRSLAALRREVEPVGADALVRFLPAWQGVGDRATGVDRTLEAVEQLSAAPIPASVLERDVLSARMRDYSPSWLDELCASGEVVWIGRGPLGPGDGRISLYLRDQVALLAPALATAEALEAEPWWSTRHAGLLAELSSRGASFWPQLHAAAGGGDEAEAVDALWDLVWAGVVTNDTVQPLRAAAGGADSRARRRAGPGRRPGRALMRAGPARAAGRWSLVASLPEQGAPVSPTERAAALAGRLLDRYGVVTRSTVAAEAVPGGFSAVYGVLKAMEEAGRARRGYFVEGLGGAQFALPGAVDRLRSMREGADGGQSERVALAATDPANPFGAALAWPDPAGDHAHSPRRTAGAYVVLVDGALAGYAERGGRSLLTFDADDGLLDGFAAGLDRLVSARQVRSLQVQRIDGGPPADQPLVAHLRRHGFADHPRGLIRR